MREGGREGRVTDCYTYSNIITKVNYIDTKYSNLQHVPEKQFDIYFVK